MCGGCFGDRGACSNVRVNWRGVSAALRRGLPLRQCGTPNKRLQWAFLSGWLSALLARRYILGWLPSQQGVHARAPSGTHRTGHFTGGTAPVSSALRRNRAARSLAHCVCVSLVSSIQAGCYEPLACAPRHQLSCRAPSVLRPPTGAQSCRTEPPLERRRDGDRSVGAQLSLRINELTS